jgi:undecaprenyl-diphosphatase
MEFVNAIFLGIVQGLTEFIPISSSGHLIIAREFLGEQVSYGLAFDSVLQLATTFAVLVYFWKDIIGYIKTFFALVFRRPVEKKEKILLYAVMLGTIPAIIIGLLFEDAMDTVFRNPLLVALMLVIGGLIMLVAEKIGKQKHTLTVSRGFWMGCWQALALVPGFSRSGMTISGGLLLGLTRVEATRFSFLLAFPVLLGAGLKKLLDLGTSGILDAVAGPLIAGSIASFLVGLLAIHFLITYLQKHTLNVFVWYRFALAIVVVVLFV